MEEARRLASALSSGTGSGESDDNAQKKPKASCHGDASSVALAVTLDGLVVTPPPGASLVSLPKSRHQGLEVAHRKDMRGRLAGKKLFDASKKVQAPEWQQEELKQLVEFMLLCTDGKS